MIKTQERERSLRKIAILFRALDEEAADRLLEQMPLDRAAEVRELAESLTTVDPREEAAIVDEFLSATGRSSGRRTAGSKSVDEGVELQLSSAARDATQGTQVSQGAHRQETHRASDASQRHATAHASPGHSTETHSHAATTTPSGSMKGSRDEQTSSNASVKPLAFVDARHAAALAHWLAGEREAIGAVVLSLLEPMVAARTLERLAFDRQRVLLERLSEIARVEPAVAEELDGILRVVLGRVDEAAEPRPGHSAVQAILAQVQAAHRARLLGHAAPSQTMQDAGDLAASPTRTGSALTQSSAARLTPAEMARTTRDPELPEFVSVSRFGQAGAGSVAKKVASSSGSEARHFDSRNAAEVTSPRPAPAAKSLVSNESAQAAATHGARVFESLTPEMQQQLQTRFDRLADWNQDSLVSLLKRVPPRVLRLAMVGAAEKLIDRVTRPLGKAEAKAMRAELERPGAVRLADITQAQWQILDLAERMFVSGSRSEERKSIQRVA